MEIDYKELWEEALKKLDEAIEKLEDDSDKVIERYKKGELDEEQTEISYQQALSGICNLRAYGSQIRHLYAIAVMRAKK